jgi:hypothetical protein
MTRAEIAEAKRRSREGSGPHIITRAGIEHLQRTGASRELLATAERGYEMNPIPNPEDRAA